MDGVAPGLVRAATRTILQPLILDCLPERRDLYWRSSAEPKEGAGTIAIAAGATLSFDSYFNSFFESQWWRHTQIQSVSIEIDLRGDATLAVYRPALGRKVPLQQQQIGSGRSTLAIPTVPMNFRQRGVLSVELTAHDGGAIVQGGAWLGEVPGRVPVGLAAVICTFNREADLARCLDALATDMQLAHRLARVIVVNQGTPGLDHAPCLARVRARLGGKLVVIEQANRGGAAGFTRGLLAALDDPGLTHAVLLDDDIEVEPGSLVRMAEFFAAAKRDVVVGGHMLDRLHPTYLYEAGAVITGRHWDFMPQHHGLDAASPDRLEVLSQPAAVHYNGWWCCGLPLALLRTHGLPLPCFIRGDDVELGLRLHKHGVPTVPMPGIAVWHEPFYLKLGGWQLYYETRNMLVSAALHRPASRFGTLRRMARQVVRHLLTYRYYSTALILDGIHDFLQGPAVVQQDPLPRHARLAERRAEYASPVAARETVLEAQTLGRAPRSRLGEVMLLGWLLVRNAALPSPSGAPLLMEQDDLDWTRMNGVHHVALEAFWDEARPVLRRSGHHHRALLRRALPLLVRLCRDGPAAARSWQRAAPSLTSEPFWRNYLGLVDGQATEVGMAAE